MFRLYVRGREISVPSILATRVLFPVGTRGVASSKRLVTEQSCRLVVVEHLSIKCCAVEAARRGIELGSTEVFAGAVGPDKGDQFTTIEALGRELRNDHRGVAVWGWDLSSWIGRCDIGSTDLDLDARAGRAGSNRDSYQVISWWLKPRGYSLFVSYRPLPVSCQQY